jgi:hypothetical protein
MRTYFFLLLILFGMGCAKKKFFPESVWLSLNVPIEVIPAKDSIGVGDTLYITANFPDSILDLYSNNKYLLKNFYFNNFISLYQISNPQIQASDQQPAISAFRFFDVTGNIDNLTSSFGHINFIYKQNHYQCKIGLVALRKGAFSFILFYNPAPNPVTYLPDLEVGYDNDGNRKLAQVQNIRYLMNRGDNHFPLFQQYAKEFSTSSNSPFHERFISYTFLVH